MMIVMARFAHERQRTDEVIPRSGSNQCFCFVIISIVFLISFYSSKDLL